MSKKVQTPKSAATTKEVAAPAATKKAATIKAEAPAKGQGRPQGSVYKPKHELLREGAEMLLMKRNGYTIQEVADHFEVEYQVANQRIALAEAPVAVHRAIDEGRIAPTTCLTFIRKSKKAAQIVEEMEAHIAEVEAGRSILGEDRSKLTIKSKLLNLRGEFEKVMKSKEVKGARANSVVALIDLLLESHNPEEIFTKARQLA